MSAMPQLDSELLKQALDLPVDQRVELVERLVHSLEETPFASPEVEAAWRAEVHRRIDEIDRGEVQLIPAEDVFRKLRERRGANAPS
jgi:putative addiction module component (TIGR02574 family)